MLNSRAHEHLCIFTASQLTQPVKTVLLAYQACCPEFEPQNPGEVGKQPLDKAKDRIPGACWPVNPAKLVSLRFSESPCLNLSRKDSRDGSADQTFWPRPQTPGSVRAPVSK